MSLRCQHFAEVDEPPCALRRFTVRYGGFYARYEKSYPLCVRPLAKLMWPVLLQNCRMTRTSRLLLTAVAAMLLAAIPAVRLFADPLPLFLIESIEVDGGSRATDQSSSRWTSTRCVRRPGV